jgi:phosphatidylserine/phosphatidylglycerophosphate/cardiolipin synthase-like enzyme
MKIHIGKAQTLLSLIENAKRRILVVSPFISPACAKLILQKQREGVSAAIVTTMHSQRIFPLLLEKRKEQVSPRRPWLLAHGAILILGGLALCLRAILTSTSPLMPAIVLAAGIILCLAGRGKTRKYLASRIEALIVDLEEDNPLHAKIYVVDDIVAIGSANFTVSGMKNNLECVAFAKGADEVLRDIDEILRKRRAVKFER